MLTKIVLKPSHSKSHKDKKERKKKGLKRYNGFRRLAPETEGAHFDSLAVDLGRGCIGLEVA